MLRKPSLKVTVTTDTGRSEQLVLLSGKLMGSPEGYTLLDDTREKIQEGFNQVIVDLTAVTLINSAGAGVLAAMLTSAKRREGKLVLIGLNDRTRRVLEFMNLDQVVAFCETLEEARGEDA